MNAALQRSLLLVAFAAGASFASAATPVIGAQLFQDTNARIDDLFQFRNSPPKKPGPADNPFRPNDPVAAVTAPVLPGGDPPPVSHETPDESMLRSAYSRLTFGGLIEAGGRLNVVINKVTYKEGGLLIVRVQGNDVYLRIIKLTSDSITLGLNDARLTLNFSAGRRRTPRIHAVLTPEDADFACGSTACRISGGGGLESFDSHLVRERSDREISGYSRCRWSCCTQP